MPSGANAATVRKAAALVEALRVLPQISSTRVTAAPTIAVGELILIP